MNVCPIAEDVKMLLVGDLFSELAFAGTLAHHNEMQLGDCQQCVPSCFEEGLVVLFWSEVGDDPDDEQVTVVLAEDLLSNPRSRGACVRDVVEGDPVIDHVGGGSDGGSHRRSHVERDGDPGVIEMCSRTVGNPGHRVMPGPAIVLGGDKGETAHPRGPK